MGSHQVVSRKATNVDFPRSSRPSSTVASSRSATSERAQEDARAADPRTTSTRVSARALAESSSNWIAAARIACLPWTVHRTGGTCTHLFRLRSSSQTGSPSAGRRAQSRPVRSPLRRWLSALHPPSPTALGLRCARREKVNLLGQKVTYRVSAIPRSVVSSRPPPEARVTCRAVPVARDSRRLPSAGVSLRTHDTNSGPGVWPRAWWAVR